MNNAVKLILVVTFAIAFLFGFLHLFLPGHDFERLHIFLFNLCGGGTMLIAYAQARRHAPLAVLFYSGSVAYTMSAYLQRYRIAILIAIALAFLAERVRATRFQFFPIDIFRAATPVAEKYLHASLLCLSISLALSSIVIWGHLAGFPLPRRLTLNIFFLGFSFPVSLATMSLISRNLNRLEAKAIKRIEESIFWIITLGVVLFFAVILLEIIAAELAMAVMLSISVVILFAIHIWAGLDAPSRRSLTSGMGFLLLTAVTGSAYLAWKAVGFGQEGGKMILRMHAILSLYGWNMCGIILMSRAGISSINPLSVASLPRPVIVLHWMIVAILAPIGFYFKPMALVAVAAYSVFLWLSLIRRG